MKTIDVYRGEKSWMCRFNDDAAVMELFGTDTLPAAFTLAAPEQLVVQEIRKLNPGVAVTAIPNGWAHV